MPLPPLPKALPDTSSVATIPRRTASVNRLIDHLSQIPCWQSGCISHLTERQERETMWPVVSMERGSTSGAERVLPRRAGLRTRMAGIIPASPSLQSSYEARGEEARDEYHFEGDGLGTASGGAYRHGDRRMV